MADIVLATLNARYIHASLGLRYLLANMGSLASRTQLAEFVINDHPAEILGKLVREAPKIVGFGVYIWNIEATTRIVADLRKILPETRIILGGPEVSYEAESLPICAMADYVISGEADLEFASLCHRILDGTAPLNKFIAATLPPLADLRLPYAFYSEEDIQHRVVYVEVSRGCPFTCEFCLSSLDIPVRQFELNGFLDEMQRLLDAGVQQFKFVDRTFNLNMRIGRSILEFFLDRYRPGLFLHFEMIPDRLPEALREAIAKFPPGALQFEIGVQTFHEESSRLISRRQDVAKLEENFRYLRNETNVHIHADLIVGLPAETLESFAAGFDRLVHLRPQEIQVGILKRLRGTPIARHDEEWQMIYSPHPPYEILCNRTLDFATIQSLRRFARYWDLIANSGNFKATIELICSEKDSPFSQFMHLSEWLYARQPQLYGISLVRLTELVFVYLTDVRGEDRDIVADRIWRDYGKGHREKPSYLKPFDLPQQESDRRSLPAPTRQRRHLEA